MVRSSLLVIFLSMGLAFMSPQVQAQPMCMGTPFECAVDDAINLGLQWFRNQEANTGHFADAQGRHNFLGALSFLEKRQGVGWMGRAQGFNGMATADQAMTPTVQVPAASQMLPR